MDDPLGRLFTPHLVRRALAERLLLLTMGAVTERSISRAVSLIGSEWPTSRRGIPGWLAHLGLGQAAIVEYGGRPSPPTEANPDMLAVTVFRDRPVGVSWFATYGHDVSALLTGHGDFIVAMSGLLGQPAETTVHSSGCTAYWRSRDYAIHIYAHIGKGPHAGPQPRPVMQIHIDAADFSARESERD